MQQTSFCSIESGIRLRLPSLGTSQIPFKR
jgi:hypothetical protein